MEPPQNKEHRDTEGDEPNEDCNEARHELHGLHRLVRHSRGLAHDGQRKASAARVNTQSPQADATASGELLSLRRSPVERAIERVRELLGATLDTELCGPQTAEPRSEIERDRAFSRHNTRERFA